ncbi:MAG: hypothetical protein PF484_02680 [Bacteroidales bacterium]|jgi:hypothetical protein|nr:hypothetical protein [Bacteroidales bacterium]
MELFLDKNFLNNFYVIYDDKNIYHEDICAFFKRLRNYKLITNYSSFDELMFDAEESNPMIHYFIETKVPEIFFNQNLSKDVVKELFYYSGSPIKILFIEDDNKLPELYGFKSISSSNIKEKWMPFYKGRNDDYNSIKTTKNKNLERYERFEKWEDFLNFAHPLHSIVISDRYILTNNTNQKVENNLFPLLRNLINPSKNESHIDIMIITHKINTNIEYNRVNSFIKDSLKLKNYHLSIVRDSPAHKSEHFRRIYTNYFSIHIENSLNIFKDNGSYIDKNNDITFRFLFNDKNQRFFLKEAKDINNWLSKLNNRPKLGYAPEEIYYYPDKKNKLLDQINI